MARYVALFRGINVGKAKRVAMADLRALLTGLGYREVSTLLNSGNALFTAEAAPAARHAARIQAAVARQLGVDALVIVKSARDIAGVMNGNVLEAVASDHSRLLVALTASARSLGALRPLAAQDWDPDRVHLGKHAAYIWCKAGILESRAAEALLRALGGSGTTRNWATLQKIHALLSVRDGR